MKFSLFLSTVMIFLLGTSGVAFSHSFPFERVLSLFENHEPLRDNGWESPFGSSSRANMASAGSFGNRMEYLLGNSSRANMASAGSFGNRLESLLGNSSRANMASAGSFGNRWESLLGNGSRVGMVSGGEHGSAAAPVPEPATMLLFGTGLVGLVGARFRKKKK